MEWGLAHVSSRELAEWAAYYQSDPFGDERADLRAGIVASVIANVNRDAKKRAKPFEPGDFMPKFNAGAPVGKQTWQEQIEMARALAGAFGTIKSET